MRWHFLLADEGIAGLFTALGIDVRVLLLNAIAFLIVVWIMTRFVFPPLTKALDAKLAELETTASARRQAEAHLKLADETAAQTIAQAVATADDIQTNAHTQASQELKATTDKARTQAKRIISEAHEQLDRDVEAARKALKAETARLVMEATATVLDEKIDSPKDAALVERALAGGRR